MRQDQRLYGVKMENKGFKRWLGYLIARIAARFYVMFFFGSNPKKQALNLDMPFIVVCNHQTDFDLALMICSFKERIVPVASDHATEGKVSGYLIKKCLRPIIVFKGSVKVAAVRQMLRAIKTGDNIMIHPEGARTFDGQTMEIGNEIGKVIKNSKAALVTYTVKGGYLNSPRWAINKRKGKVSGNIVNIYTADMLKNMTADEITDVIRKDIYINDYESHSGRHIVKDAALGIENFLFICPKCRKIGTIKGEGNRAVCNCGFYAEIDDLGYLGGEDLITWGKHQKELFLEMYSDSITFTDEAVVLGKKNDDYSTEILAEGILTGTAEGISIGEYGFSFDDMDDELDMIKRGNTAVFSVDKVHYYLTGEKVNMYKYWLLYRMKTGMGIS